MYIVWRKRQITSDRKAELFMEYWNGNVYDSDGKVIRSGRHKIRGGLDGHAWKPLYCNHRGPGRIAWTPFLMHAERVNGKPRQKLLQRLPTIRSCCIKDKFIRAAWWHDVNFLLQYFEDWDTGTGVRCIRRDRRGIVAKLREVVPSPSKAGRRQFTAYRLEKEAEQNRTWHEFDDHLHQQAEEQHHRQAEVNARRVDDQARRWREVEDELRRGWEDISRLLGIPNPFGENCWAVLGLPQTATADQIKSRYLELVKENHPDRFGDPEMFKRVQRAYESVMVNKSGWPMRAPGSH